MKLILYTLIFILAFQLVFADIKINEIMYNPEGSDNNKEFIEIYSNETINLSDFTIADSSSSDSLTLLNYYDSDYYLITEEGFNFSGIEASVYSAGAAIGNNLNTEDSLFIYYNGSLVDDISYTNLCESGHSLEYFNGSFYCSFYLGGTPGRQNSNRNLDYSNIMINEFFPDPEGDDNAPMPDGEFIELYNDANEDIDLFALYFKDSSNHKLYITDTTTIDGTTIKSNDYLAVYMNGFSGFLNNEDIEEIKLYDPDGNLIDQVMYGGSTEGLSWSLVDNIWQHRLPTPNERNSEDEVETDSYFKIEKLENVGSDNEAEFGDIVRVKFHVYKGNTTKSSIKLYIENDEDRITKITKAMLHNKFTNYSLTLPIPIYSNCKQKYDDGDYYVRLGWTSSSEEEDSFEIKVKGINMDNCDKIYVEKKPRKGTVDYRLIEYPTVVKITEEFTVKVELTNNGEDNLVDIYSYVYKGPKCHSGNREENKKTVLVKSDQTKEFELTNVVNGAEPGDYKLKVKIKRQDQKTEKELTQDIKLLAQPVEIKSEPFSVGLENTEEGTALTANYSEEGNMIPENRLKVVYESTSIKTKNMIPYFIIVFLTLFSLFLILNKKLD